jgi:molybdopterin-guanine dinucleotide biosynthesis protein A
VSEGRLDRISGAVLLGGASARMGRDKAQLRVGGEALAVRTAALLASICDEVLLVGGDPPAAAPGRRVPDGPGPRCALRGLVAALGAARGDSVLVVATDLPGLTPDLLLALVAQPAGDAVMPRQAGRPQPLCALYRRATVLRRAERCLVEGRLAMQAVLDATPGCEPLGVQWLEGGDLAALDPEGRVLANVNTPDQLARFEQGLAT